MFESGFSEEVLFMLFGPEEELSEVELQAERLSFVNSKTKRELRGAWEKSEMKTALTI